MSNCATYLNKRANLPFDYGIFKRFPIFNNVEKPKTCGVRKSHESLMVFGQ
jgi:hypothetical protein